MGTPAIPYILDKIQEGNTSIFPSLYELLKNNKDIQIFNSLQPSINYNDMDNLNLSEYEIFRDMIEKEQ